VSKTDLPKLVFATAAHKSPPLARRSCSALFDRSQSGLKLPFASVQARVAVVEIREVGRLAMKSPPFCAASRYRPMLNFSAVLPSPNKSIATPPRGVRSLYESTPGVSGNDVTVGRKRTPPIVAAGKMLVARSNRSAPCKVIRPAVHCSCA
jgi:hypothetical protein